MPKSMDGHRYKTVVVAKMSVDACGSGRARVHGNLAYYFGNYSDQKVTVTVTRRERIRYNGKKTKTKKT